MKNKKPSKLSKFLIPLLAALIITLFVGIMLDFGGLGSSSGGSGGRIPTNSSTPPTSVDGIAVESIDLNVDDYVF